MDFRLKYTKKIEKIGAQFYTHSLFTIFRIMKTEDDKIKISKASFREWLEKLQQESWQLELLISGFALFAIWEARTLVDGYEEYISINITASGPTRGILNTFGTLLTVSWKIFFYNLLIHVLARGLWIGAIGLRYVSSDIDYDYFNYSDIFTNFLKKNVGDFDDYIERLERFSSVIFAYTFLLFFVFLSLIIFNIEIFTVARLFDDPTTGGLFIVFFAFFGLFIFIDFITMGGIKKIKEKNISRIYFVIYRIFSFLTLSFLYRPLLYNFWDEKYTRRLFLISIPYMILLFFIPKIESNALPFFPIHQHNGVQEKLTYEFHYYDDERQLEQERKKGIFRKKHAIDGISLPSIELSGNYGRFFLRSYPSDATYLESDLEIPPYKESGLVIKGWGDGKDDEKLLELDSLRSLASTKIISTRMDYRRKLRKNEINSTQPGIIKIGETLKIDSLYWQQKADSINEFWSEKKATYQLANLKKLNKSILDLATIKIDGVVYNDSCECKFYVHPNLGEKGLRCYFPMKNLVEGPHLLHLKRREFYGNKVLKDRYEDYHIPFYKIQKDF